VPIGTPTLAPTSTRLPTDTPTPISLSPTLLEDFQSNELEGRTFSIERSETALENGALVMFGTGGTWHKVGLELLRGDLIPYEQICFDVMDGAGSNTVGLQFRDTKGHVREAWSDWDSNPKTQKGFWVNMCFQLAWFREPPDGRPILPPDSGSAGPVDLAAVESIVFVMYPDGRHLFDNVWLYPAGTDPEAKPRVIASLPATISLEAVDGSTVPFAYGKPLPSFDRQAHRPTLNLAGTWNKQRVALDHDLSLTDRSTALALIEGEGQGRHLSSYDDSSWETKTLPAVENIMPSTESAQGAEVYEDGVWYRRTFAMDSVWKGKQVRLVFLAVNYVADIWINGIWAGYHEGGYTPFALDVTELLEYGGPNTIAVRVDNPPWGSRTDIVPAVRGDWHNYTGIVHDVYLEQIPPQYIARADMRPLDTDGNLSVKVVIHSTGNTSQDLTADVAVHTANVNDANITSPYASDLADSLVALDGIISRPISMPEKGTRVPNYEVRIPSPRLWTPADPNLYVLKLVLHNDGTAVDEFYTQFGLRTVGIGKGAKFFINDRPAFLTGIARHEDWLDTGRAAAMDKIKTDLDLIKQVSANFLRTAHYPNHPYTYLLTDRMGLAVMEEIPTWWFGRDEWAAQEQRRIADQMWREMIFRDYNRPSIVLWSGTNEAREQELRQAFLTRINQDLKLNYNDGRLVTQSAAADRPGPEGRCRLDDVLWDFPRRRVLCWHTRFPG
jgi:beta-glucuronidase